MPARYTAATTEAAPSSDTHLRLRAARAAPTDRNRRDGPERAASEPVALARRRSRQVAIAGRRETSGFRVNRVLGRIVPLIILVYLGYAYDLVVVRYAYGHVYRILGRPIAAIVPLVPAHIGFVVAVRAYLQVFLAYSSPSSDGGDGRPGWLARRLGAKFEAYDAAGLHADRDGIRACGPNGAPLRCWRDRCNGRIRAARTRHCGDCGTCRVGFDHHCAWFDNDVTAPATLRPFVRFLVLVPLLFGWAFAPLLPVAWRHARSIWRKARHDPELASRWWSRWYSWAGGPVFRYVVGWAWAGRKASQTRPTAADLGQSVVDRPSLRVPLLTAFGFTFSAIAIMLCASTLRQLSSGTLTIDVERRKTFHRLSLSSSSTVTEEAQAKLVSLDPHVYFSVPLAPITAAAASQSADPDAAEFDEKEIVSMSIDDGVWQRQGGWWRNLAFFLWDRAAPSQMLQQWPLSDRVRLELVQRAREQRSRRTDRAASLPPLPR
ncbi:hypothetical protein ACQY0O_004214 [Thecaphora frezii]